MRKFKENLEYLQLLLENKDHLIDRLSLTDAQKEELKSFFKAHPNYESRIDWNNKKLTYEDFKSVLGLEGKSRNSVKKYGISGKAQIEDLKEGTDYEIVAQTSKYTVYYVKTFKASEVLAKPTTPPEGIQGHWCIAGRNYSPGTRDQHWKDYTSRGYKFFFIFTSRTKYALSFHVPTFSDGYTSAAFKCFTRDDHEIRRTQWPPVVDQALEDIKNSDFIRQIKAQAEEEERQIKIKREANTAALKQEITKTIEDLANGIIDPKFIRQFRDPNYHTWDYQDMQNLKELNFWDTWFPSNGSIDSNSIDYPEICRFMRDLDIPVVKLPDTVNVLGPHCFQNFINMHFIEIPESVKIICNGAFWDTGIQSLVIPKTVRYIEPRAFRDCDQLKSIEFQGLMGQNLINPFPAEVCPICPSLEKVTLPANLAIIREADFYGCSSLKEIAIPDTVVKIETLAFVGCRSLAQVHWPANLSVIEGSAFKDCVSLNEIILPSHVTSIGSYAFDNCTCNKVILPHSLKAISKESLHGLSAEEVIYRGTKQEWETLLANPKNAPSWGTWYSVNILPKLKFQPEN